MGGGGGGGGVLKRELLNISCSEPVWPSGKVLGW